MKFAFLCLFVIFVSAAYAQTPEKNLEIAYKKKSASLLKEFFNQWAQNSSPITNIDLTQLNDTVKNAYQVFTVFYKPTDINRIGGSEWGKSIYTEVDFLIVQNSIKIYFTEKIHYSDQEIEDHVRKVLKAKDDSSRQELLQKVNGKLSTFVIRRFGPVVSEQAIFIKDSITDFRPIIDCNGKTPLYLTQSYNNLLNAFLGNTHIPFGTENIMNPARSSGESEKRKKFLEKQIKIWYGHWGGYWELYSYPQVSRIIFDKYMQYAKVEFRMVYEGGEAILKNNNGHWELLSARRTWIE